MPFLPASMRQRKRNIRRLGTDPDTDPQLDGLQLDLSRSHRSSDHQHGSSPAGPAGTSSNEAPVAGTHTALLQRPPAPTAPASIEHLGPAQPTVIYTAADNLRTTDQLSVNQILVIASLPPLLFLAGIFALLVLLLVFYLVAR